MSFKGPGAGPYDVSVVIPAYNRPDFLDVAVATACAQEDVRVEVIVVDDASDPPLRRNPDWPENVRFLRAPRRGVRAARNHGAWLARSELLCFLDDDDGLYATHLRSHREQLRQRPDIDVSYCQVDCIDGEGRYRHTFLQNHRPPRNYFRALAYQNIFPPNAAVLRRDAFLAVGGFEEGLHPALQQGAEDYDLWLNLAASGCRFQYLAQRLCFYRRHGGNKSWDLVEQQRRTLALLEWRTPLLAPLTRLGCRWWLARPNYSLGRAALAAGEWESARQRFRAAITACPWHLHARAYYFLATERRAGTVRLLQQTRRRVWPVYGAP